MGQAETSNESNELIRSREGAYKVRDTSQGVRELSATED